jgi:hypothetical protein
MAPAAYALEADGRVSAHEVGRAAPRRISGNLEVCEEPNTGQLQVHHVRHLVLRPKHGAQWVISGQQQPHDSLDQAEHLVGRVVASVSLGPC